MENNFWLTVKAVAEILVPSGTFFTAVWLIIKAAKILPSEKKGLELTNAGISLTNKNQEVSVAESMEKLAERAASKVLSLQEQIDIITQELRELRPLKDRITLLECELENYKEENAALRDWAEALVNQVKAVPGLDPVKMRPVKKIDCQTRVKESKNVQ